MITLLTLALLAGSNPDVDHSGRVGLGFREGSIYAIDPEITWFPISSLELTAGYSSNPDQFRAEMITRLGAVWYPNFLQEAQTGVLFGLSYRWGTFAIGSEPLHTVGFRATKVWRKWEIYGYGEEIFFNNPGGLTYTRDFGIGMNIGF